MFGSQGFFIPFTTEAKPAPTNHLLPPAVKIITATPENQCSVPQPHEEERSETDDVSKSEAGPGHVDKLSPGSRKYAPGDGGEDMEAPIFSFPNNVSLEDNDKKEVGGHGEACDRSVDDETLSKRFDPMSDENFKQLVSVEIKANSLENKVTEMANEITVILSGELENNSPSDQEAVKSLQKRGKCLNEELQTMLESLDAVELLQDQLEAKVKRKSVATFINQVMDKNDINLDKLKESNDNDEVDVGPGHVGKRPQESGSTPPVPDTSSPPLIPPNVPLPPEHMVVKTSYHGVLSADQAKARLRDQRLDKAYICRESDVRSGEYVISYYLEAEVKHILLPIEKKSKKSVVEVFSNMIRSKDYLQYPVSPVGGYEWSDAHFQRPRGRGQGRRGAVRGRRGATRGRPGASRGRRGAARGQRPGRSQSGGSRHGEQSKAGCCGQGHGQDDCGDVGDTGGSCHDHEHDNAHDDHNDGSPKELCFVCSETIDKKFLAKHLKVHRQSWCGECLKYINYNTFWSRHRPQCTAYHSADLLTCEVSYCNYSTKWRDHMKNHQKFHITKPFNCKSCSRCFETAEQLEIHTINKHSNPRHRCHYCDRGFRDSYDCNRHMRSQHLFPTIRNAAGVFRMDTGGGVRRKKGRTLHNCSECNFKTTVRKRLHRHTRAKHCPKTPTIYLCQGEGCNFKHHFKSRYARHIKTCKRFKVRCQK